MKFLSFILFILILSALLIISNSEIYLLEQGFENFSIIYLNWLDKIYSNVIQITGQVISQTWLP